MGYILKYQVVYEMEDGELDINPTLLFDSEEEALSFIEDMKNEEE